MRGNLTVSHAYDDSITYLNTNYPNLIINVTDGKYIRFTDPNMETYMISQKVDLDNDTHITIDEVKSKTVFRNENYSFMNLTLFKKIT